jgi:hypothetical protein
MVRVANCNPKDTENYDKKMLDYVKTHMAPQVRCFCVQQCACMGPKCAAYACIAVHAWAWGCVCTQCSRGVIALAIVQLHKGCAC